MIQGAETVVVYGPGGVGKSELCSLLPHVGVRPVWLDIGASSKKLNISRVSGIDSTSTWEDLRAALHEESLWKDCGAVVIDDITKAQELATNFVIRNVKHKGGFVNSIEDYGWGEGYTHVYEAMLPLLGDLDHHVRAGRHVIGICHECTANVPNPGGDDWLRYEPRLSSPKSGKSSVRHRIKEWCDHLLFINYDTAVGDDGKGKGAGTRTIYPTELPTHWAKSRTLANPIVYRQGEPDLWKALFSKGE